jgi:glycoside/pentoside/hexuronide:cation symporter, GPH family
LTTLPLFWVKDPPQRERPRSRLLKELLELSRDRILRRFALARLFFFIEEGMIGSLLVFSFGVGLKLPEKFFWLILILWIATLAAVPLILRLSRHFEKHHLLAAGFSIYSIALATLVWAPAGNFPVVALVWAIVGVANSAVVTLPTSIVADIVDHDEVSSGERRSGAYVAIDNLMLKVGLALGLAVAFGLLEAVGYDPSAAQHSAADVWKIRLLGFGLPAVMLIPAVLLVLKHPITREVQQRLRAQISLRQIDS